VVRGSLDGVIPLHRDLRGSIGQVFYGNTPRAAADLAVFHVLLVTATPGIQCDLVDFSAVRTQYAGAGLGGAVPKRELLIQIIVI
jgi:hypothetical protein